MTLVAPCLTNALSETELAQQSALHLMAAISAIPQPASSCEWFDCTSCEESSCSALTGGKLSIAGTRYFHVKTTEPHGERGCSLYAQK